MGKTIKVLFIILVLITVFTKSVSAFSLSDIWTWGQDFIDAGKDAEKPIEESEITSLSNTILSILQIIAIALALIMAAILGIKYMAGSVEQQAEVKKTLVPYIVGCVVAFGAFTIWKVVLQILQGLNI